MVVYKCIKYDLDVCVINGILHLEQQMNWKPYDKLLNYHKP